MMIGIVEWMVLYECLSMFFVGMLLIVLGIVLS